MSSQADSPGSCLILLTLACLEMVFNPRRSHSPFRYLPSHNKPARRKEHLDRKIPQNIIHWPSGSDSILTAHKLGQINMTQSMKTLELHHIMLQ